eukprot:TRINITY_DN63302_c0_g1_i1.p1 TRINITY_DN63302_c0_g1~~TRINITY_DN63302_c0_g1_i1.p1  ORF type:complete len:239 (+),score=34.83 TRINITY_DN63302_c0_g1_i1:160-876(+)
MARGRHAAVSSFFAHPQSETFGTWVVAPSSASPRAKPLSASSSLASFLDMSPTACDQTAVASMMVSGPRTKMKCSRSDFCCVSDRMCERVTSQQPVHSSFVASACSRGDAPATRNVETAQGFLWPEQENPHFDLFDGCSNAQVCTQSPSRGLSSFVNSSTGVDGGADLGMLTGDFRGQLCSPGESVRITSKGVPYLVDVDKRSQAQLAVALLIGSSTLVACGTVAAKYGIAQRAAGER